MGKTLEALYAIFPPS